MITAHLKGGLGNQLFQYARARTRAKDSPIALDVHYLEHTPAGVTKRALALEAFNIGLHEIVSKRPSFADKVFDKLMRMFEPGWGYFQSERHFVHEAARIRKEFTLKNPGESYRAWERRIREVGMPVSIHVRRGDYANDPRIRTEFGLCSETYYRSAMRHIEQQIPSPTYVVFSDDIEWVKKNLPLAETTLYVIDADLSDAEELVLMSLCCHHIIANSSFAWWGAWLDPKPDKIVIAPTPWFDTVPYDPSLIPASWITLPKN